MGPTYHSYVHPFQRTQRNPDESQPHTYHHNNRSRHLNQKKNPLGTLSNFHGRRKLCQARNVMPSPSPHQSGKRNNRQQLRLNYRKLLRDQHDLLHRRSPLPSVRRLRPSRLCRHGRQGPAPSRLTTSAPYSAIAA